MATIGEIVETLELVTENIGLLYKKINILTERVENLERGVKTESCPLCEGTGYIEVETGAFTECYICHGTGKINVMTNI